MCVEASRSVGSNVLLAYTYVQSNHATVGFVNVWNLQGAHEQALVCLSNREIVDASRGRTFHCKMANNRFFSLIVSA